MRTKGFCSALLRCGEIKLKPERQKIRPRERVYPYDIIVYNGGLEQY